MHEPAASTNIVADESGQAGGDRSQAETRLRGGAARFNFASGSRPLAGYTIKRGIGIGGFGEVYYATSDAGKEVALKCIQRNLDVELRGVSQCLNFKHPNLLALYDIRYDDSGQAWVVMEYVAGESLQDVICRHPEGMPREEVLRWFQAVAAGVSYLHDQGIVHRDLKPGNIFLDQGVVKVGDYGLCKFISCSRRSNHTESVGTFHYMAPEIGQGRYGKEIDIYALGVILYEMLTGRPPFDGESSQEIIMKHLTAEPDLHGIDGRFGPIVARALHKDAGRRFESVAQMAVALQDGGPAVSAGPTGGGLTREGAAVIAAEAVQPRAGAAPAATGAADEPIARAVRIGMGRLQERLQRANLNTLTKVVLLTCLVLFLMANAGWLIPASVVLGAIYAVYLVLWSLLMADGGQPGNAPHGLRTEPSPRSPSDQLPAGGVSPPPLPVPAGGRRGLVSAEAWRWALAGKSPRQRAGELIASLLMAALVSAVLCVVMLIFGSTGVDESLLGWAPLHAWLTLTTMAGSWAVLVLGQVWQGTSGEEARRRFCMLVVGLAIGATAWGLGQLLMLRPTYVLDVRPAATAHLPQALYDAGGAPRLLGYMGYFAALLVMLRWWKQADPLRPTRLSIWSTLLAVLAAVLVHAFLPCPHGFLLSASMAIAIQLSAPWLPPEQRLLSPAVARS